MISIQELLHSWVPLVQFQNMTIKGIFSGNAFQFAEVKNTHTDGTAIEVGEDQHNPTNT